MHYYLDKLLRNVLDLKINTGENEEELLNNVVESIMENPYYVSNYVELSKRMPFSKEMATLLDKNHVKYSMEDENEDLILVVGDIPNVNEIQSITESYENVLIKSLVEETLTLIDFVKIFAPRIKKEADTYGINKVRLGTIATGEEMIKRMLKAALKDEGLDVVLDETHK